MKSLGLPGLSYNATKESLKDAFSTFGEVVDGEIDSSKLV